MLSRLHSPIKLLRCERERDACNAIARDRLIETFHDDDAGYRSWLYANLGGYVVNALRGANPGEPVLHRATCDTITPTPDKSWPAEYIKICFDHRFELESSARTHGRRLTSCEFCAP